MFLFSREETKIQRPGGSVSNSYGYNDAGANQRLDLVLGLG